MNRKKTSILDIIQSQKTQFSKKEEWSIKDLHKNFNKIKLDLKFQRRGPWGDKNRNNFIKSLFGGFAMSNITIVDVNKSHIEAKERGDKESEKYFQELEDEGMKYVSLDGNNRSTTIFMLLNKEIPFPAGLKIKLKDGTDFTFPKDYYIDDFKEEYGEDFNLFIEKTKVSFNVLQKATVQDLSDSFIQINKGISITSQEVRNANEGNVSQGIRELSDFIEGSKENPHIFIERGVFSKKEIDNRTSDEVISMFLLHLCQGKEGFNNENLSKSKDKELNKLFNSEKLHKKYFNRIKVFLQLFKGLNINKKITKSNLFNLYFLINKLEYRQKEFKTNEDLMIYFKDMIDTLNKKQDFIENNLNNLSQLKVRETLIEEYIDNNLTKDKNIKKSSKSVLEPFDYSENQIQKEKEINLNKTIYNNKKTKESKESKKVEEKDFSDISEISLSDFETLKNETFVDTSFQRRPSWSDENKEEYILSLLEGRAFTDILVANVEYCHQQAKIDKDEVSKKYFGELKEKGIKYVSIDGNNRSNAIEDFRKGTIELRDKTLRDKEGNTKHFERLNFDNLKKGKYNLNKDEKFNFDDIIETIENIQITYTKFNKLSKSDLNNTFLMINEGIDVNDQEKRNATQTKVAEAVKEISDEYQDIFETKTNIVINEETGRKNTEKIEGILDEYKWKKRDDDKIISTLLVLEQNYSSFKTVSSKNLDDFFDINKTYEESNFNPNLFLDFKDKFSVLMNIVKLYKEKEEKLNMSDFYDLYIFISNLKDSNYTIEDLKEKTKEIKESYDSFRKEYKNKSFELEVLVDNKPTKQKFLWKQINKDLGGMNIKERINKREEIILSLTNGFIEKDNKFEITEEHKKEIRDKIFNFVKLNNNIKSIVEEEGEYTEEAIFIFQEIKKILNFENEYLITFFYEELYKLDINQKIKKETIKKIKNINSYENIDIEWNSINTKEITKEGMIKKLGKGSKYKTEEDIIDDLLDNENVLRGLAKSELTELTSWIYVFFENDFETLQEIIKKRQNEKLNDKDMLQSISLDIFKTINQRSITIKGEEVISPFEIKENPLIIKYNKAGKGIPDSTYFPLNPQYKELKSVGVSATSNSKTDSEGTQLLRHPRRIHKLTKFLLEDSENGEITNEKIEELKKNNDKLVKKELKAKGKNDSEEINEIIIKINEIIENEEIIDEKEQENRILEILEEEYGFNDSNRYMFYLNIDQTLNRSSKENLKYLSEETFEKKEKEVASMFLNQHLKLIFNEAFRTGYHDSSELKGRIRKIFEVYMNKNIENVMTSKNKIILERKEEKTKQLDLYEIILKDFFELDFKDTQILQYQYNENGTQSNKESDKLCLSMIKEALEYLENPEYENKEEYEKYMELIKIFLNKEVRNSLSIDPGLEKQIKKLDEKLKNIEEKEQEELIKLVTQNPNFITDNYINIEEEIIKDDFNGEYKNQKKKLINKKELIKELIQRNEKAVKEKYFIHYINNIELIKINEEEEIFWSLINPLEKREELKKEYKDSGKELAEWIIDKYLEGNIENKKLIEEKIKIIKDKGLVNLAKNIKEALERQIEEILQKEGIDLTREENKELKERITKSTLNKLEK